jgi:hydroxyacylglutathione hydrolase
MAVDTPFLTGPHGMVADSSLRSCLSRTMESRDNRPVPRAMQLRPGLLTTVSGILIVAAAATLADFVWYTFGVSHGVLTGLVHGALLLTVVGGVLGAASGRLLKGLPIGTLAGLGGATAYYLLVAVVDPRTYGTAIPGAWVVLWLLLTGLDGRWLRAPDVRTWREVAVRGVVAAGVGGIAFALVRQTLWGAPGEGGRSYLVQFAAWAVAWAPGLLALTWGAASSRDVASRQVSPAELSTRIGGDSAPRIVDVRSEAEYRAGHVPGAVHVPFTEVTARWVEIESEFEDEVIVYCGHGPRAWMAGAALRRAGFTRVTYLAGHWAAWRSSGLTIER